MNEISSQSCQSKLSADNSEKLYKCKSDSINVSINVKHIRI